MEQTATIEVKGYLAALLEGYQREIYEKKVYDGAVAELATLQAELDAARGENERWRQIVTDDQTDIDNAKAAFTGLLTAQEVYGDSYGVPTIDTVCALAAAQLASANEKLATLAGEVALYNKYFDAFHNALATPQSDSETTQGLKLLMNDSGRKIVALARHIAATTKKEG